MKDIVYELNQIMTDMKVQNSVCHDEYTEGIIRGLSIALKLMEGD